MTTTSSGRRGSRPPTASRVVFADTVYWVALVRRRDEYRDRVLRWQEWVEARGCRIVPTSAVMWEAVNACSHPGLRPAAVGLFRMAQREESVETIPWANEDLEAALALFESRPDKARSLTDCWSFVVMRARQLTGALTTDQHFLQAGYRALLLEEPPTR